jgi:hypothetical protein
MIMGVGSLLAMLAAVQALPEAATTPGPAAAAQVAQQGVIPYPAAFFASAQPNTAMDMIQRMPGFSFDGGDDVRGFTGAAGNVLVDGERPTSKSDNLESVLRRIPASQVDRIDLIRGGAPGIDMQGKNVIANVVRKKGAAVTGLVAYAHIANDDGRQAPQLRLEGTRRDGARLMEGSFVVAGFFDDGAGDGSLIRVPTVGAVTRQLVDTEGDGTQAIATAAFETPFLGGKIRTNGQLFFENFNFDYLQRSEAGVEQSVQRDGQRKKQGEFGLNFNRPLWSGATLEVVGLQQLRNQTYRSAYREGTDTSVFYNDRTTSESIGRGVVRVRRSETFSYEFGVETAFNRLDSETTYTDNGAPVVLPAGNVVVEELRGELFVGSTWKMTPTLTLESRLRGEASRISSKGEVALEKTLQFAKPRAVLTWSPNAANQVRLRVEREVGQLDFDDFVAESSLDTGVVRAGNPNLNPERGWTAEGAYERRFLGRGALVLTYRHSWVNDVIDRAPVISADGTFDSPANIGDASVDRVDVSLTLPLDRIGVKGGLLRGKYTGRWSAVDDPTTGATRRISGEHATDWEGHFSQDVTRLKLTWGLDVFGGWNERYYRFNEIETYKLRPFAVPFAEVRPRPDITIRFEVRNAGARGFERIRESWTGPRNTVDRNFVDTRDLQFGRMYYVRLRKTFG